MTTNTPRTRGHGLRVMSGRDPQEEHRAATPLELLFDLTFVVAFGAASNEFAHLLAETHYGAALAGFAIAIFAIVWAWINYSWFASAYDTDDWAFRLATMVIMVGAVFLALGLPRLFHSIDEGGFVDNGVIVAGYVVMRVAMIFLWLRAARQDPKRRATCETYALTIGIAQVGWVVLIVVQVSIGTYFAWAILLVLVELIGPFLAERRKVQTPWHAHHIAERFGLLTIITLGEGIIGTVASLGAVVDAQGWTVDAALVAVAGVGLTFGLWWSYFILPSGDLLQRHRERSFGWGYGHIPLFAALVATGAGLHVAALYIESHGEVPIGPAATVLTVAIPVGAALLLIYGIYTYLVHEGDAFHFRLLIVTIGVLVLTVVLAAVGVAMPVCLIVLMCAPLVTVIGYETLGHQHQAVALERQLAE